jgi:hypothetical protein
MQFNHLCATCSEDTKKSVDLCDILSLDGQGHCQWQRIILRPPRPMTLVQTPAQSTVPARKGANARAITAHAQAEAISDDNASVPQDIRRAQVYQFMTDCCCTSNSMLVARRRTARFGPKVCVLSSTSGQMAWICLHFFAPMGMLLVSSPSDIPILVHNDEPPRVYTHDTYACAPCSASTHPRSHRSLFFITSRTTSGRSSNRALNRVNPLLKVPPTPQ